MHKLKQQRLTEMMKRLPEKEKESIEIEERRMQRLELQEIKHNLWRKWRGKQKREEETVKEKNEDVMEKKLRIVEDTLRRVQEEKRENDKKLADWKIRRKALLDEGKLKQEEKERKAREKKVRLQKKASLEEKWELLRWTTEFIDDNKDGWEKVRLDRERNVDKETILKDEWSAEVMRENITEYERWRKTREKVSSDDELQVHRDVTKVGMGTSQI